MFRGFFFIPIIKKSQNLKSLYLQLKLYYKFERGIDIIFFTQNTKFRNVSYKKGNVKRHPRTQRVNRILFSTPSVVE